MRTSADAVRVFAQVRVCSSARGDGRRFSVFKCAGDTQFTGSAAAFTVFIAGDGFSQFFTG